jgi:hypothetical protein
MARITVCARRSIGTGRSGVLLRAPQRIHHFAPANRDPSGRMEQWLFRQHRAPPAPWERLAPHICRPSINFSLSGTFRTHFRYFELKLPSSFQHRAVRGRIARQSTRAARGGQQR